MGIELYGIANCDTVKKARAWLKDQAVAHRFHDFKKEGVDEGMLAHWCDAVGWETLLNRRGTTWRRLSESERDGIDRQRALALMAAHPSLIKRPVLVHGDTVAVGFSEARYRELCRDLCR